MLENEVNEYKRYRDELLMSQMEMIRMSVKLISNKQMREVSRKMMYQSALIDKMLSILESSPEVTKNLLDNDKFTN